MFFLRIRKTLPISLEEKKPVMPCHYQALDIEMGIFGF
jgi:hypothetical protein